MAVILLLLCGPQHLLEPSLQRLQFGMSLLRGKVVPGQIDPVKRALFVPQLHDLTLLSVRPDALDQDKAFWPSTEGGEGCA